MPYPYYPSSFQYPYIQQQSTASAFIADWIQGGIQGMKAYPLSSNQKAVLFDTESNIFGIKCVDASGMPLPLRVFNYSEINAQEQRTDSQTVAIDTSVFVTREEFEALKQQIIPQKKQKKEAETNAE